MKTAHKVLGIHLRADPCIPEFIEKRGNERKWAHRVMWQRWKRYKVVKKRCVMCFRGVYFAHPNTVKLIEVLNNENRA